MKIIFSIYAILILSLGSVKAQSTFKTYDDLISAVSKVFDEALKGFILTTETKTNIKDLGIANFKKGYPISHFTKQVKLTDDFFTKPLKNSILNYNDSTKYKWTLMKESQFIQVVSKYLNENGFAIGNNLKLLDCFVTKFKASYPNADFNVNSDEVAIASYNFSKECGLMAMEGIEYSKIKFKWNDSSRSGLIKKLLGDFEKKLSGLYTYNELIDLARFLLTH